MRKGCSASEAAGAFTDRALLTLLLLPCPSTRTLWRFTHWGRAVTACWQWFEDLQGRVEDLHARGWSDTAIVAEVLPRTWFAVGQEVFTLWDLSSLNLVQSILYGPVTRPEVDDVMRRIRSSSSR